MRRSLLFVGLAVLSATPVFGQSAAERQLAADIRILEQRTDRIEQALAELSRTIEGLGKQLTENSNATRKLSADQAVVVQEVVTTVGVLREQLAETNQRLTTMRDASTASAGSRELFEHARADYMAGNYPLAVQGFTAYLNSSPQSSDAASAQYYLGEAFRLDGKLNEALTAYDRLIAQHCQ